MNNKIKNPVTHIAWAAYKDIKWDQFAIWDVVETIPDSLNKFDPTAVAFVRNWNIIWHLSMGNPWKPYHESLIFTIKDIKVNAWWFVKYIYVEINWHECITDVIQDNQTWKPACNEKSDDWYRLYWQSWDSFPSITSVLKVKLESEQLNRWLCSHADFYAYKDALNWYALRWTIVHNALEDYTNTWEVYDNSFFIWKDKEHKDSIEAHNAKVDKSIEEYWYSKVDKQNYKSLNFHSKWKKWWATYKETSEAMFAMYKWWINFLTSKWVEVIEAERMMFNKEIWIAGSCDALIKKDWEFIALDYKTSASIQKISYKMQASFYAHSYNQLQDVIWLNKCKAWLLRLDPLTKKGYQYVEVADQATHTAMIKPLRWLFEYFNSWL